MVLLLANTALTEAGVEIASRCTEQKSTREERERAPNGILARRSYAMEST